MKRHVAMMAWGRLIAASMALLLVTAGASGAPLCEPKASIKSIDIDSAPLSEDAPLRLTSRVEFHVEGLKEVLACVAGGEPKLALFIDHKPLVGLDASIHDASADRVLFSLGQTKDIAARRLELYRNSTGLFTGGVSLGLGFSDGRELPALVARQTVSLQLISPAHLALWLAFAVGLVLVVIVLAWRYGMLQDAVPGDAAQKSNAGDKVATHYAYSLSKTQLALWFVIVTLASTYIAAVTGQLPALTSQTLWLIGISAGTSATALAIDHVQGQLPGKRAQFLVDILSDANGITIPRLQIAVITVVLVGYFVIGVARDLALPTLDATWSGLMGIGSLTYLGFKIPEKKTNSN